MILRILEVKTLQNFKLMVCFETGEKVLYDVSEDINSIAVFKRLRTEKGLFEQVQIDESRTCIFWDEQIDLPSDSILEFGEKMEN